jgi:VWFA-related protein
MEAHNQLLDFVDHAPAGTRFALFGNMAGLKLVVGFTNDHQRLRSAILSQGTAPHLPKVFLDGNVYGYEDAGAALSNLRFIAEYMRGIPGRKNLFWLSSEFPIPVGPAMNGHNSNNGVGGGFSSTTMQINDLTYLLSDGIKETYAALESSQMALYPIDLNGIQAGGDAVANYQHMDDIAAATGGHAYYGNNRLPELLNRAVANGADYYALTYSPTNTKYDGSERHIKVRFEKNKDYVLSYRTLYYGVRDDEGPGPKAHDAEVLQARFVAAKQADNLYANIEHGAPMLHDLIFTVHVEAEGAPRLATPEQMLQLADTPVYFRTRRKNKPLKPPAPVKLQKYRLQYQVIDWQLKPVAKRKGVQAVLEFAAAAYDADGRLLNGLLNEGVLSQETTAGAKTKMPFQGEQEFEVPPGAAWLRVAVRDKLNNRTGTYELPLPLKQDSMGATLGTGE